MSALFFLINDQISFSPKCFQERWLLHQFQDCMACRLGPLLGYYTLHENYGFRTGHSDVSGAWFCHCLHSLCIPVLLGFSPNLRKASTILAAKATFRKVSSCLRAEYFFSKISKQTASCISPASYTRHHLTSKLPSRRNNKHSYI